MLNIAPESRLKHILLPLLSCLQVVPMVAGIISDDYCEAFFWLPRVLLMQRLCLGGIMGTKWLLWETQLWLQMITLGIIHIDFVGHVRSSYEDEAYDLWDSAFTWRWLFTSCIWRCVCVTGYSLDEINDAFFHYLIFFSSCLYMFILSGHVLETTHDH